MKLNFEWQGDIEINGKAYIGEIDLKNNLNIMLYPAQTNYQHIPLIKETSIEDVLENIDMDKTYKITVKSYMTTKSSSDFTFMQKWNDDNPMPFRIMIGKVINQTQGMLFMNLYADITQEITTTCMKCGRPITNPVSQFFGTGPECGGHNYVNPFKTKEELHEAVEKYRKTLRNIKWSGWVIKKAITSMEEINDKTTNA